MGITLPQSPVLGSSTAPYIGLALGSAVTAHNTLLVIGTVLNGADGTTVAQVSDSVNGTWPSVTMGTPFNGEVPFVAVLPDSAAGSPALTIGRTGAGAGVVGRLFEIAGALTASPVGVSNADSGSPSVPSIGLTGVSANSAIFAIIAASSAPTPDAGWISFANGAWNNESTQYILDAGAAGSKTSAWTSSVFWGGVAVEIKSSSSGGGAKLASAVYRRRFAA